jgi:hypothetical protein
MKIHSAIFELLFVYRWMDGWGGAGLGGRVDEYVDERF